MLKGRYYDAAVVHSLAQAEQAFLRLSGQWGAARGIREPGDRARLGDLRTLPIFWTRSSEASRFPDLGAVPFTGI